MQIFHKKFNFRDVSITFLITVIIALIFVGVFLSFVTVVLVSKTSGEKFCGGCHTMQPMVKAYKLSPHGGNNRVGVQATCVECHLPHDGTINYMYVKAKIGFHDVWAEIFYDKEKIDWEKKRDHRDHFVYDSGCLNCHKSLVEATKSNRKAFIAHRSYFNEGKPTCVSCHENVGHKDLRKFLNNR